MGSLALSRQEQESLRLPAEVDYPVVVRHAYDACLAAFARGRREESYAHMAAILQHYQDCGERIPEPCGHLYFTLVTRDIA